MKCFIDGKLWCCDVVTTDDVTTDPLCVASLLLLWEKRPDHNGAQHEAQADHGVQRRGEGRASDWAERVDHQRVTCSVQATDKHPRDHHNYAWAHYHHICPILLLAYEKWGEGGHSRHEGQDHPADGNTGCEEEQLEPLLPDPCFEHGTGGDSGQAAAQGQQAPDEADLLSGDTHRQGQVGLTGAQDTHGQPLAHVGRPRRGEVGEKPGLVIVKGHADVLNQVWIHLSFRNIHKTLYFNHTSVYLFEVAKCISPYFTRKQQHHGCVLLL